MNKFIFENGQKYGIENDPDYPFVIPKIGEFLSTECYTTRFKTREETSWWQVFKDFFSLSLDSIFAKTIYRAEGKVKDIQYLYVGDHHLTMSPDGEILSNQILIILENPKIRPVLEPNLIKQTAFE